MTNEIDAIAIKIKKNSQSILALFLSSFMGKALSLVSNIALARLLMPENFGVYSQILSITLIVSSLNTNWISDVFLKNYDGNESLANVRNSLFNIMSLMGVFSSIILFCCLILTELPLHLIVMMVFFPLIQSMITVFEFELRQKQLFGKISLSEVALSSTTAIVSVTLAFFTKDASPLILGLLIGSTTKLLVLVRYNSDISFSLRVISDAKINQDAVLNLLNRFVLTVIGNIDYLIMSLFFSPQVAGLYFFSLNFAAQWMRLFANNSAKVFFSSFINEKVDATRNSLIIISIKHFILVSFAITFLFALASEQLINVLFGDKWKEAEEFILILVIAIGFRSLTPIASTLIIQAGKFKLNLMLTLGYCSIFICGMLIAAYSELLSNVIWFNLIYALIIPPFHLLVARWKTISFSFDIYLFVFLGGLLYLTLSAIAFVSTEFFVHKNTNQLLFGVVSSLIFLVISAPTTAFLYRFVSRNNP